MRVNLGRKKLHLAKKKTSHKVNGQSQVVSGLRSNAQVDEQTLAEQDREITMLAQTTKKKSKEIAMLRKQLEQSTEAEENQSPEATSRAKK